MSRLIAPILPTLVAPLKAGDRLTVDEFERRYRAMSADVSAELIGGVVHMAPPVSIDGHGGPHAELIGVLIAYKIGTPGVRVGNNVSVRLDMGDMPQPDVSLLIVPAKGGRTDVRDGMVVGGPELVAEIAATTAAYDLHAKLAAYRRHGVIEYLVFRTTVGQWDHFVLRGSDYVPVSSIDGVIRSTVFPGLWIDARAVMTEDSVAAAQVLRRGLATPEHAAFAASLAAR